MATSASQETDSAAGPGPLPPLDLELAAALEEGAAATEPHALTFGAIPKVRAEHSADFDAGDLTRGGKYEVQDRTVPGPEGAPDIRLLTFRPVNATEPRPTLINIHGGGMMIGDLRLGAVELLEWSEAIGDLPVVSIGYRLAPEHAYPAQVDDCYAGLLWTAEHAAEIGGDPERLVISGASAGGGLSAATALKARDLGGPRLFGQALLSPMLDDRDATDSTRQMTGSPLVWNREVCRVGWEALLGDARGGPDVPYYAAPARATDLAGLPPAFLDVGSSEAFRTETVDYAERIWRDGGIAELHVWPGGCHSFDGIAPDSRLATSASHTRIEWLRRLLRQ